MMEETAVHQGTSTHGGTMLENIFLTGLQFVEKPRGEQVDIPEELQPVEES